MVSVRSVRGGAAVGTAGEGVGHRYGLRGVEVTCFGRGGELGGHGCGPLWCEILPGGG